MVDERIQRLYDWYRQGHSITEIGRLEAKYLRYDKPITKQRISKLLSEHPDYQSRDRSEATSKGLEQPLTAEQKQLIYDLNINHRISIPQISKISGMPEEKIIEVVEVADLDPVVEASIIAKYKQGVSSIQNLADKYRVKSITVLEILEKNKVPIRPETQQKKRSSTLDGVDEETKRYVWNLKYNKKFSVTDITELTELPEKVVRAILKKKS